MQYIINILDKDFSVDFDYKVTYKGDNGSAPSLSHPGDPPTPMEYELTINSLSRDGVEVTLMPWLIDLIDEELQADTEVYDMIASVAGPDTSGEFD